MDTAYLDQLAHQFKGESGAEERRERNYPTQTAYESTPESGANNVYNKYYAATSEHKSQPNRVYSREKRSVENRVSSPNRAMRNNSRERYGDFPTMPQDDLRDSQKKYNEDKKGYGHERSRERQPSGSRHRDNRLHRREAEEYARDRCSASSLKGSKPHRSINPNQDEEDSIHGRSTESICHWIQDVDKERHNQERYGSPSIMSNMSVNGRQSFHARHSSDYRSRGRSRSPSQGMHEYSHRSRSRNTVKKRHESRSRNRSRSLEKLNQHEHINRLRNTPEKIYQHGCSHRSRSPPEAHERGYKNRSRNTQERMHGHGHRNRSRSTSGKMHEHGHMNRSRSISGKMHEHGHRNRSRSTSGNKYEYGQRNRPRSTSGNKHDCRQNRSRSTSGNKHEHGHRNRPRSTQEKMYGCCLCPFLVPTIHDLRIHYFRIHDLHGKNIDVHLQQSMLVTMPEQSSSRKLGSPGRRNLSSRHRRSTDRRAYSQDSRRKGLIDRRSQSKSRSPFSRSHSRSRSLLSRSCSWSSVSRSQSRSLSPVHHGPYIQMYGCSKCPFLVPSKTKLCTHYVKVHGEYRAQGMKLVNKSMLVTMPEGFKPDSGLPDSVNRPPGPRSNDYPGYPRPPPGNWPGGPRLPPGNWPECPRSPPGNWPRCPRPPPGYWPGGPRLPPGNWPGGPRLPPGNWHGSPRPPPGNWPGSASPPYQQHGQYTTHSQPTKEAISESKQEAKQNKCETVYVSVESCQCPAPDCKKHSVFKTVSSLIDHWLENHSPRPVFTCKLCKYANFHKDMKKHLQEVHNEPANVGIAGLRTVGYKAAKVDAANYQLKWDDMPQFEFIYPDECMCPVPHCHLVRFSTPEQFLSHWETLHEPFPTTHLHTSQSVKVPSYTPPIIDPLNIHVRRYVLEARTKAQPYSPGSKCGVKVTTNVQPYTPGINNGDRAEFITLTGDSQQMNKPEAMISTTDKNPKSLVSSGMPDGGHQASPWNNNDRNYEKGQGPPWNNAEQDRNSTVQGHDLAVSLPLINSEPSVANSNHNVSTPCQYDMSSGSGPPVQSGAIRTIYVDPNCHKCPAPKCHLSFYTFSKKASLIEHWKQYHSPVPVLECIIKDCQYANTIQQFKLHLESQHKLDCAIERVELKKFMSKIIGHIAPQKDPGIYELMHSTSKSFVYIYPDECKCPVIACPITSVAFASAQEYIEHWQCLHEPTPTFCCTNPQCQFFGLSQDELRSHYQQKHNLQGEKIDIIMSLSENCYVMRPPIVDPQDYFLRKTVFHPQQVYIPKKQRTPPTNKNKLESKKLKKKSSNIVRLT